jgi:hypothetical protein
MLNLFLAPLRWSNEPSDFRLWHKCEVPTASTYV